MMRGVLSAYGDRERVVWAADSFAGLPAPDEERYPADVGDRGHTAEELAVPLDEVQDNFRRYGLLDEQVKFLPGWFRETLPTVSKQRWAIVRLDGDLYESTMDGLVNLYPRLSPGGFLIIDDYGFDNCRAAVDDQEPSGRKAGVEVDESVHRRFIEVAVEADDGPSLLLTVGSVSRNQPGRNLTCSSSKP